MFINLSAPRGFYILEIVGSTVSLSVLNVFSF